MTAAGWIAVDLDGTLAHYDGWQGPTHIGPPIPAMAARVKKWLAEGKDVRIFTARAWASEDADPYERESVLDVIRAWCRKHLGTELVITCTKDYGMIELWDDRAVQVEANTGRRMDGQPDPAGPP